MKPNHSFAGAECGCSAPGGGADLITVDRGLELIETRVPALEGTETLPLAEARGRVLAAPVLARLNAPLFDNSAMDGYAIDTAALHAPGPWSTRIATNVAAGDAATALPRGTAARVLTGAPLPAGADAVIAQEHVSRDGDRITIATLPATGQHIRRAGEDIARNTSVLTAGHRLGPRQIAACAATGHSHVAVRRQPRVVLVTTGNEIGTPGAEMRPGQIPDINTPMLQAAIARCTGTPPEVLHHADDRENITATLATLSKLCDLIVTTGGVSVGDADHLKPAFDRLGGRYLFSGVALKPGKPVCLGHLNRAHWLGLPGNPLSAFVTWTLFGKPLLAALLGQMPILPRRRLLPVAGPVTHRPGRTEARLARLARCPATGADTALCDAATHSGRVHPLALADGLAILPADATEMATGDIIEFLEI